MPIHLRWPRSALYARSLGTVVIEHMKNEFYDNFPIRFVTANNRL